MKIISHRGNVRGPLADRENRPSYIDCAIGNGYDVEIDVRLIEGQLWLGHDGPQYKVEHSWLQPRKEYLWIHCKDLAAAQECCDYQSFCHTSDPYTYTTTGKVWLHDLSMNIKDAIIPLIDDPIVYLPHKPYAICTDYPYLLN